MVVWLGQKLGWFMWKGVGIKRSRIQSLEASLVMGAGQGMKG